MAMVEVVRELSLAPELAHQDKIFAEAEPLYRAFGGVEPLADAHTLFRFAANHLDFRAGRAREDTAWHEGPALGVEKKQATIDLANNWGMLETTYPTRPFDLLVVMGAHKDSLELRVKHALEVHELYGSSAGIVALSCYRSIHPKETVTPGVETEADLAVALLEQATGMGDKFKPETVTCWNDLPHQNPQTGENAVAYIGKLGQTDAVILSGSKPDGAPRASTISTLETLGSFLENSRPRLLFVTTALHLPYQNLQVRACMPDVEYELVGAAYPSLAGLSTESPDAKFRIVLQEIGATLKNAYACNTPNSVDNT